MSRNRRKEETFRVIRFYGLVLLVVLLDQLVKFSVLRTFTEGQSVPVIPEVFHLTLVFNHGIAFGLFQEHGAFLLILITVSLIFLVSAYRFLSGQGTAVRTAMALIIGGAIGNWIDRLRVHAVVDYLDFRVWPVFNLADSAITVGVVIYLWAAFRGPQKQHSGSGAPSAGT